MHAYLQWVTTVFKYVIYIIESEYHTRFRGRHLHYDILYKAEYVFVLGWTGFK